MQTRKLALLSTMLIGLGGGAIAQQATDPAQDPLLEQEQGQTMQHSPEASPEATGDAATAEEMDALTPEEGVAGEGTYHEDPARDVADDLQPDRSRSVTTAAEPYTETVLGGMTADELIGMDVVAAEGEGVGSVADLLIGPDNTVDRAIIDVGGFLGFGGKTVAIDIDRLTVAEGDGEVVVDLTSDELDAMPEWQADDEGWFTD